MKLISTDRSEVIRSSQYKNFTLSFVKNRQHDSYEIILQSDIGKHRATHRFVNILNERGEVAHRRPIDVQVADFIFKYFDIKGDTESFSIYSSDLESGKLERHHEETIAPEDVRHTLTDEEKSFTANGAKLWYHKPIFDKFRETGFGSIIRATMTNHQVCASRCQFCSTIARNKKDSISLQEAKDFVDTLYFEQAEFNKENFPKFNAAYSLATGSDIRLKGLILSGGGQPNLWPHFSEFVEYLSSLDIDLGLITNGFPKHIDESVYEKFKWIRISITPEDASPFYPEQKFNLQYFPKTIINSDKITVGYSYVFGPWTNDDILMRIDQSMDECGFVYCRTLTDCNLTRDSQILAHRDLAEKLYRLGFIDEFGNPLKRIFHQLKYHGTSAEANAIWEDGQCYLQTYNVFWDTTGHEKNGYSHCYACDSVTVLTDKSDDGVSTSERKFNYQKWGTVTNKEVEKLFNQPVKSYFDPRSVCTSCLFMRNNKVVKDIVNSVDEPILENVQGSVQHVNFP